MEQLDLLTRDETSNLSGIEPFGCCALYRECSDAGECVNSNRELSVFCSYYKNLIEGKIFYGKKAVGFEVDEYNNILQKVGSLSPSIRAELDSILIDFFEYHRGIQQCVVRNLWIEEISAVGLFEFRILGPSFPPVKEEWNVGKVKELIKANHHYYTLFQQAQTVRATERKPLLDAIKESKKLGNKSETVRLEKEKKVLDEKKPGENTKKFIWSWLNRDAVQFRESLAEPYRIALLTTESRRYAEELYRDTLLDSYSTRIYRLSPFAEDGLLSFASYSKEEFRRVQLSPGYSNQEKSDLIERIERISVEI